MFHFILAEFNLFIMMVDNRSLEPGCRGNLTGFLAYLLPCMLFVNPIRGTFNPLTPRSNLSFSYCQPYNSYNVRSENLVLNQPIIPKLIFFFILITYLVDIVMIL